MLGILARKGCQVLGLAFLVASLPVDHAFAGSFYFNSDFQNTTGGGVNDFHITLQSSSAINGLGSFATTSPLGPSVVFPSFSYVDNNSTVVGLNWSGATIPDGDWTHVGAYGTASSTVSVTGAFWTVFGIPSGSVPFPSISSSDPLGLDFGIVRVTLHSALNNGSVLGHVWYEGPADPGSTSFASVFNANFGSPTIYASWAFNTPSPTPIPIEDLNESLTGFGPESAIQALSVPEPGSLLLLGLGLGLYGCVVNAKRVRAARHAIER